MPLDAVTNGTFSIAHKSYYGVAIAPTGKRWPSGYRVLQSSRFPKEGQAYDWLVAVIEANPGTTGKVYPSSHPTDFTATEQASLGQ